MGEQEQDQDQQGINYEQVAQGTEDLKEMLRVMLAAARAEGFTEEQAHDIVAGLFRSMKTSREDD